MWVLQLLYGVQHLEPHAAPLHVTLLQELISKGEGLFLRRVKPGHADHLVRRPEDALFSDHRGNVSLPVGSIVVGHAEPFEPH